MLSSAERCGKSSRLWKTTATGRSSAGTAMPAGGILEDDTVERDASRVERDEPGQRVQQGRLAAAVRTEDRDRLAGVDREVDARARRCRAARGPVPRGSWLLEPAAAHDDEDRERDRQQDEAQRHAGLRTALELDVDGQRNRLRAAGKVAGERDRRAELAERARPAECGAGGDRRAGPAAPSRGGTRSSASPPACAPRPPAGGRDR